MALGAKVQSEAIADFETALGRFAQVSLDRVKAAEIAIRRLTERLEERRIELRRELVRLQDEIVDSDDEGDTSHASRQLEEAEQALSNVKRWQRTVNVSMESYKRESAKFQELDDGITVAARAYLRRVLDDLAAYFSLQSDGLASSLGVNNKSNDVDTMAGCVEQRKFDPTAFVLPPDFFWIPIIEIDTVRELAEVCSPNAFKKVGYDEMRRGFDALRNEILPAINNAPNPATKDTFACRDAAAGIAYERGLLRVYEAFFGEDSIHLERGKADQLFSVSNGRHRIRVAMDAGWTAIPVKMKDPWR